MQPRTLYDKLWDSHLVKQRDDGSALIYIDRHLIHEVTSPQAFEGLSLAGRKPWRLDANLAVITMTAGLDALGRLTGGLITAAIATIGGLRVIDGSITVGDFVLFLSVA